MSILTYIKRICSPYTNNTEAKASRKSIGDEPILSERERDARILELLDNPMPSCETIEELA